MGRIGWFVTGVIVGAALLWGAMGYHVVRSSKGVVLIPKLANNLGDPYVDIREFTLTDWQQHRPLAAAILKTEHADLLNDSSIQTFRDTMSSVVKEISKLGNE